MLDITRKSGYKRILLEELEEELFNAAGNCNFSVDEFLNGRLSPHSSVKTYKKDINGYTVLSIKCTGLLHDVTIMVDEDRAKCFMCGFIGASHEGEFFYVTNCDIHDELRNHLNALSENNRRVPALSMTDNEKQLIKYKDWPQFIALIS